MKKILVIGATGQIGSALMTKLRKEYGNDNVVAGYIEGVPLSDELKNGGPLEIVKFFFNFINDKNSAFFQC